MKLYLLVGTVILVALVTGSAIIYSLYKPTSSSQNNSTENQKTTSTNRASSQTTSPTKQVPGSSSSSSTPSTKASDGSGKDVVQISISALSQDQSTVHVRVLIQSIQPDGTCVISIKNGSQSISKTVSTQNLSSTSTCEGFDIPTNELGSGTWSIVVNFTSGQYEGTSPTRSITVN